MKIYALFLPQFHEIEENNKWWGKGFTEWKNVKNAEPIFSGHKQPLHPVNNNYYNLLDKKTVEWQTDLMHQYGIDGFVYYHYYFNGKMLLEKPAENLQQWKDIDQPFFFNWANHTWKRSWNGTQEILLKQEYGTESDWTKHFDYLLRFFKDDRYIKIDNKPVLMIYDTAFPEYRKMMSLFNDLCIKSGYDGLYLIEESYNISNARRVEFENRKSDLRSRVYLTQPAAGKILYDDQRSIIVKVIDKIIYTLTQRGVIKRVKEYNGDTLIKAVMKTGVNNECEIIPGLFFSWDNTPRHKTRGSIISEISHDVFMQYMNAYKEKDMMIINAWNEWCEGMFLEPSLEYGDKYLQWIKEWKDLNEQ